MADVKQEAPPDVLYAVVSDEGLVAARTATGFAPLVAVKPDVIRKMAEQVAVLSGKTLWIREYRATGEDQTVTPEGAGAKA